MVGRLIPKPPRRVGDNALYLYISHFSATLSHFDSGKITLAGGGLGLVNGPFVSESLLVAGSHHGQSGQLDN